MKIGHARVCLSPSQEEFYLIGYRSPTRLEPALGIHDDIYANSFLFDDGTNQVFLFVADFIEFEVEMVREVQAYLSAKYGINAEHVLLAATHNHSSVVGYHKSWYTGKFDQTYYDFLLRAIEEAYLVCCGNRQEAVARYGRQEIHGYYNDRNHPNQDADQEVIVLEFLDKDGKAFAGIVNWAVHSTVIGPSNRYLTSEWAGEVSKRLYDSFGYYPAMLVGAAADCSNRHFRQGKDFDELERVSQGMATEIARIDVTCPIEIGQIASHFESYRIQYDPSQMIERNRSAIARYEKDLETCQDKERQAFVHKEIQKLSEHLDLSEVDLSFDMGVIKFGDLCLVVFPGELDSAFGKSLKEVASGLALIAGYTNGYLGYFMPAEEYGLSFETIGNLVPKGEPERVVDRLRKIIQSV